MEHRTTPTTNTVETVEIGGRDAQARGRNGWFRPQRVTLQRCEADRTVVITAESSRPYGDMPPIHLSLPLPDARRVHEALGRQIAALDAERGEEHTP